MPNLELRLISTFETLDCGLAFASPLTLPAISTLQDELTDLPAKIQALAKEELEQGDVTFLYQHALPGTPRSGVLKFALEAPRGKPYWIEPLELTFHYLSWRHSDDLYLACIPALNVQVLAQSPEKLAELLPRQARFALERFKALDSLENLAALQRVSSLHISAQTIQIAPLSPRQRAQKDEQTKPEKPVIQEVGEDLTTQALSEAFEIDELIALIAEALTSDPPRSVLLCGKSGCGKTAAIRELVRQRARHHLGHTPFWNTSGSRLVAGMTGYGMWQERCQKLCREAAHARAIVVLGNILELLDVGKAEGIAQGVGGFLRPYIARGELLVIGECTPEQIPLIERRDPQLLAVLQRIDVSEPDEQRGRRILERQAESLRKDYDVSLTAGAIDKIDRLHRRYATYSAFPGRPLRFLDSVVFNAQRGTQLNETDVASAFSRETGLPAFMLDPSVRLELDEARAWFAQRVLGQPQAIETVLDVLVAIKAGLARPRRPLASLLFIGPTGVGKTEMAKALAELFFGDRTRLSRFDMSEFAEGDAVYRLVGSPGRGEGVLTAKVREQPFSVILFDEIEKAHPACFDLLLQVLGDARLTDAAGRVAEFSNAIVILTSNLGAESYQLGRSGFAASGRGAESAQSHFTDEVQRFFRPEFVNRLDHILPFAPLNAKTLRQIAAREIELVRQRDGLLLRRAALKVDDAALDFLTARGSDTRYGARPLKREIDRQLLAPLAEKLNSYAAESLFIAEAGIGEGGLKINASARSGDESDTAIYTAGVATLCGDLRRKMQRLQRCSAISELRSDIWRLERLLARLQASGAPPRGTEKLPHLQRLLREFEKLLDDTHRVEEQVTLRLLGRSQQPLDIAQEHLRALQQRLSELMLALYALQFERPDYLLLGIYAEERSIQYTLLEAYLALAHEHSYAVMMQIIHLCSRRCTCPSPLDVDPKDAALAPYTIDRASEIFDRAQAWRDKALGFVLVLRGALVAPRLLGEHGDHVFKLAKSTARCRVETSSMPLKSYTSPEGLGRKGAMSPLPVRREFDMAGRSLTDAHLGKSFSWTGASLNALISDMIEQQLQRRVEELLQQ
ncbi:MAG TPA: AAA family ATPase [Planctomycetota bacterium]|nr:AAA family ATPase [Planctomycetota bacterium]